MKITRKTWEAIEMVFWMGLMCGLIGYALAGTFAPMGWHA